MEVEFKDVFFSLKLQLRDWLLSFGEMQESREIGMWKSIRIEFAGKDEYSSCSAILKSTCLNCDVESRFKITEEKFSDFKNLMSLCDTKLKDSLHHEIEADVSIMESQISKEMTKKDTGLQDPTTPVNFSLNRVNFSMSIKKTQMARTTTQPS